MLVQTIYQSRARARISVADIAAITLKALPHNLADGLTGILYYDDWRFLHIIEGQSAPVADAMQRIATNPLHCRLKIRLMIRSNARNFEDWPFGIISSKDSELCRAVKNLGYRDLFQANVLDIAKVLKRVAGRKYRTMNHMDKRGLSDPGLMTTAKIKPSLTEEMLGLSG